ncbi:MAG: alpha/beta hydrolase [Myxococcota bacterium]|nr:alpha/beta hydrolase [Myxococcota bacterium]
MPYLDRPGARLFYDQTGADAAPAILTTHGVSENGSYWSRTGVSRALADAGFRVIDTDMRGHGRSVPVGSEPGYDADSIAADFGALADHLGLERFHLLTHATGGMAGLRYAMDHSDRLLSLISTDTGSATVPTDEYCDPKYDDREIAPLASSAAAPMAEAYERLSVHQILEEARRGDGGPFLNRLNTNPDPERCWRWTEEILSAGNPLYYAAFQRSFYTEPDPQARRLRGIRCPNLVLLGEHDVLFVEPSKLLARCLPEVEHVVLDGLGHMLAIEDPERTGAELLRFLRAVG